MVASRSPQLSNFKNAAVAFEDAHLKFLNDDNQKIVIIEVSLDDQSIISWLQRHMEGLDQLVLKYGAVLLRGGGVETVDDFKLASNLYVPNSAEYVEGGTPRVALGENTYTSTEHPKELPIFFHNELSYIHKIPEKIVFNCISEPSEDGATPIADVRQVLNNIDKEIVNEFRTRCWKLVRNFGTGFGPDLMRAFNTTDINQILSYSLQMDMECEVIDEEQVRTSQVRKAIQRHPISRDEVWINHVAFWHPYSLPDGAREQMESIFAPDEMPFNVFWGDGTQIDDEIIANIRDAYFKVHNRFAWRNGDLLLMDNILMAHGRESYEGNRSIIVSMGYR